MKKRLLKSLLLLCALIVGSGTMWGSTEKTISWSSAPTITNNSFTQDGITFTFSKGSTANSNAPAYNSGTSQLRMYAGWSMTISVENSATIESIEYGYTLNKSSKQNISVSGASGNTNAGSYSNTTWTGSDTHVTFATTGTSGNVGFTSIKITYTTSGGNLTDSDLAITNAPVALNFDLYNNSSAQTVSYTTSSTGAVTVSGGTGYVTTSVNTETKTVTVTPTAVTPSAQTITISQESDGTYAAGSATFTVSIDDSTPIQTHTASFSVNGTIDNSNDCTVAEGAAITFPSNPAAISGKSFVGWTTAAISGTTNTAPTLVTSANMGNADVTYYAVFATATKDGDDTYEKLSSNSFDTNAKYVIGATQSSTDNTMWYLSSYSEADDNVSWGVMTSTPSTVSPIEFSLSGSASSLVAKDGSGNYLEGLTTGKFKMSSTSVSVALDTDGKIKNSSDGSYNLRHNYNGGNGGLRWYSSSTGTLAYFYKVIPGVSYSNYCTSVVVTYSVTYDGNGNTSGNVPTDANAYSPNASVTVLGNTGNLAKTGYTFGGWNTQADGQGTDRAAESTFNITSDVTLYAKWNVKTCTNLTAAGTPTKTTYSAGESFDPTGLTVTATYNDASQEDVTASVTWTPDPLTQGTTSVTGTYMGQTVNVSGLTVNAVPGSADNPYTVAEVEGQTNANDFGNNIYVTGYIVGSVYNNKCYKTTTASLVNTNLLIADTRDKSFTEGAAIGSNEDGLIPVELPTGTIRADWGVSTNNSLIGYKIIFKGNAQAYFGTNGIKGTSEITAVSVPAVVTSAGYATFSSTNALDFQDEASVYAYIAAVDGENISFTRVNKVPANTGLLLRRVANEGTVNVNVPVFDGTGADDVKDNLFVAATTEIASLASEANNCKNYILNNGSEGIGFYLANDRKVGAGKAYLAVPNNAGVRGFIGFDFSDPTTGIAVVKGELQQTEGAYDLQGRRVSELKNGLYIVNGKKVLVK